MAAQQVKLLGLIKSPFSCRVEIALKLKGVEYEFIEDNYSNKSADLLKYNPVYKKIPVLVHNGKPIAESAIIVEYIDETFNGPSILPDDPYEKANARFWAKFIDDKLSPDVISTCYWGKGEEQQKAEEEVFQVMKTLEKQLEGKKFFGGDKIGLVDIVAIFVGYWLGTLEQVVGIALVTKDEFVKLSEWIHDFVGCDLVKECLPPRDILLETFRDIIKNAT